MRTSRSFNARCSHQGAPLQSLPRIELIFPPTLVAEHFQRRHARQSEQLQQRSRVFGSHNTKPRHEAHYDHSAQACIPFTSEQWPCWRRRQLANVRKCLNSNSHVGKSLFSTNMSPGRKEQRSRTSARGHIRRQHIP